jgi:hypothetical protein
MFRIEVTSSDGRACAVTLQVSDHRSDPSSRTLNDIADRLRIPRAEIVDVLTDWTADDLRRHLESLTAEELRSPAFRRG